MVRGTRDMVSFYLSRWSSLVSARRECWLGVTVRRHTWPNANWRPSLARTSAGWRSTKSAASHEMKKKKDGACARRWWLELNLMIAARRSLEPTNHAADLDSAKEEWAWAHDWEEENVWPTDLLFFLVGNHVTHRLMRLAWNHCCSVYIINIRNLKRPVFF